MVTIIIPCYNSELFIKNCLNSVLSQTYKDIEVIIIDDCSTDNTIGIVKNIIYFNKTKIKLILLTQIENKGAAISRNIGIDRARGEYIYFLDSDDIITNDCIELLQTSIRKENFDMAIGSQTCYSDNNTNIRHNMIFKYTIIQNNRDFYRYKYTNREHSLFGIYTTNILFRLSFFRKNDLHFKPLRKSEDKILFLEMMPFINSCILIPNITYHYIQRKGSLSGYLSTSNIPLENIKNEINTYVLGINILKKDSNNFYFSEMILQEIKSSIWMLSSIYSQRKRIKPKLSLQDIKPLYKHPLAISKILKLKRKRYFHILYFIIGILPIYIKILFLRLYIYKTKKMKLK